MFQWCFNVSETMLQNAHLKIFQRCVKETVFMPFCVDEEIVWLILKKINQTISS